MFRVAASTDIGPRKKSNQDSCCALVAQTPVGDAALLAVCDGVGGLSSGELASSSMVTWLADWFETKLPQLIDSHGQDIGVLFDCVQGDWDAGTTKINDALRAHGREAETQLGTTCTAILLIRGSYIIVHVGDSRVYRFMGDGRMEILTIDQTWVAQEVARGNITPEKARNHPKRNIILQSVGTQSDLQPVFKRGGYEVGDAFMVCCDGFRNELFDDELIGAFASLQSASEPSIHDAIDRLIALVLGRGERDNITAVVGSVQGDAGNGFADEAPEFSTMRFDSPASLGVSTDPQPELSGRKRAAAIAGSVMGSLFAPPSEQRSSQTGMFFLRGRHAKPRSKDRARESLKSIPEISLEPEDPDATLVLQRPAKPLGNHARVDEPPAQEFKVMRRIVLTGSDEVVRVG